MFLPIFITLDNFLETLSIKQLIQNKIFEAIASDRQQYIEVDYLPQIASFLRKKVFLCPFKDSNKKIIYRCAISFFLANISKLPPLYVANRLITLLSDRSEQIVNREYLEISICITGSGYIDFHISDHDISIWLNFLATKIKICDCFEPYKISLFEKKNIHKIFPLQYIYGRCFSLLNLAKNRKIINLKYDDFSLKLNDFPAKVQSIPSQNKESIRQICLMIDYLAVDEVYEIARWKEFTRSFSKVWLEFIADCQFGRDLQQNEQKSDRFIIIFLIQYCIHQICISKFGIAPQKEI